MKFLRNQKGATAIEYALIASLLSVVIIVGATALGGSESGDGLKGKYEFVGSELEGALQPAAGGNISDQNPDNQ